MGSSSSRRRLLGAPLAVAGLAGAWGAPLAADTSFRGFVSQRVDAGDSDGGEVRGLTNFGLVASFATPRTSLTLAPGGSYALSTEEGGSISFRFVGSGAYRAPRFGLSASLSVLPDFVDEVQFEDTGTEGSTLQIDTAAQVGATLQLDPLNRLSAGLSYRRRDLDETTEDLVRTQSLSLNGGLQRSLSARTDASLSPAVRYFLSEAEGDPRSLSFSVRAGADHRVNERLRLGGSLGPALTFTSRDDRDDSTSVGLVGGLDAVYTLVDATISVGFAQDIDQNSRGEVQNQSRLRLGVSRRIDARSTLGLTVAAGFQNPLLGADEDRRTLSVSPVYRVQVLDDWAVSAGYRFRFSDDNDVETSNLLFLQVSRDLALLP